MKKTLLIALLLAFATGTAFAQNQNGPGQSGGKNGPGAGAGNDTRIERMTEQLGLDELQVTQITAIIEASDALRAEEQEAFRQIMSEIRDNTRAEILLVLTPEQLILHEELQQKREEFRRALEDVRAYGGFGAGRGKGDCSNQ
jgi:Spy/CpxP family protein refolding chaperone